MDILATYWNSVWCSAVERRDLVDGDHTSDEWAAYERSLQRANPVEMLMRDSLRLSHD